MCVVPPPDSNWPSLAGWPSIEIKCVCGRDHVVLLAAVSPHGPDLVAIARRLRCKACGAAPTSVRLHRRVVNGKNGFGAYSGFTGFIYDPNAVVPARRFWMEREVGEFLVRQRCNGAG